MSARSSKTPSQNSVRSFASIPHDENYYKTPEFIYGGPFIEVEKPSPFLNTASPINLPLQGTFKKSYAYYSLKERLPVILTKIIDYMSREGSKIKSGNGASDEDIRQYIQCVTKLKNDLVTNKTYDPFTVDTLEAQKWNKWIEDLDIKKYFLNTWLFTECYVYRKLREGCELSKGLKNFDPFEEQKRNSFQDTNELMCIVAEKVTTMLPKSEKDKRKADFIALLKICLWANKCDLSLTLGEKVSLECKSPAPPAASAGKAKGGKGKPPPAAAPPASSGLLDPFQMIIDYKDRLLVDDTSKIADQVCNKADSIRKAIDGNTTFKAKCSCHRLAKIAGVPICNEQPAGGEAGAAGAAAGAADPAAAAEPPKIPCPAKMTIPQTTIFDIVCDNAGYELFADLCLATFLVSQKIVKMVRFHVKKYPWFVSDVTLKDFKYVIDACAGSSFRREIPAEPKPAAADGTPAEQEPPRVVTSEPLRQLADMWKEYLDTGVFMPMADEYWTYPHGYKDMKRLDYNMYRKLQFAVAILFKGDLNYRKLLADKNCNPAQGLEPSMQGFIPAPIIACRTVKSEVICGLPRGRWDVLTKHDDKWMITGDYGVIQFCAKAEPFKPADRPCIDYCGTCFGVICPEHKDI